MPTDLDGVFEFDADVSPIQRFINFKAAVLGRALDFKDDQADNSPTRAGGGGSMR